MSINIWIEVIGLIGSGFVGLSLTMKNILKLRIINMIGAIIFVLYGFLLSAYSVLIVNTFIIFVNLYFLYILIKKKDTFSVLNIESPHSAFFQKFVTFYFKDIKKFFPNLDFNSLEDVNILMILRNMIPVGIFISKPANHEEMEVLMDYVIPDYRDFKNAHFIYLEESRKQKINGFHQFVTRSMNKEHIKYLKKMDYIQDSEQENLYRRKIR